MRSGDGGNIVGFFNLIYGVAAIANYHVFVAGAHYVFGDLRSWGWITLIIAGNQLARWFGVAVIGLSVMLP